MSDLEIPETVQDFHTRLQSLGPVECSRFVSGWGFAIDGAQFAIAVNESLYLHVDDNLRSELQATGSKPFSYSARGQEIVVERYYSIPANALEDNDSFQDWSSKALSSARPQPLSTSENKNRLPVLLVCTSHAALGNTGNATGVWFAELAMAYNVFTRAGIPVKIASPAGGEPPTDPGSNSPEYRIPAVIRFEKDKEAVEAYASTLRLDEIEDCTNYCGTMLIGGHGTMWDFPDNPALENILTQLVNDNKPIGAVCHGVAGLLNTNLVTEKSLVFGKKVTSFTNEEEKLIGLTNVVPFLLEDRLVEDGAQYVSSKPLEPHLIVDGNLVTGQNPWSTHDVAKAIAGLLSKD
ncbi:MAG: TfoX/Sxy family protein [Methyloligellaceae bacterium]